MSSYLDAESLQMSLVKDFGMHRNGFRVGGGEMQGHTEKKAV